MSKVFKDHIHLYSCLQEFQEKAVKTLNSVYGQHRRLEFFDFSVDEAEQRYIAV